MNQQNNDLIQPYLMGERVTKEGLVVLDDITYLPLHGEAYISPFAVVSLCTKGFCKCEYDGVSTIINEHDICIMPTKHIFKAGDVSSDYHVRLIVLSEDFAGIFKRNNQIGIHTHIEYDLAHPRLHLSDKQFYQINVAFDLLKAVSDVGTLYRKDMMLNIFNTIMMMRHEFSPPSNTHSLNNGRMLSAIFKQTVIDHHSESHEVSYYARMFNLSPKYFSTLIKQEMGISATEWINNYIALRAKSILAQQKDISMQQISDLLGFTEQTSFSRFFKRNFGISPMQFRAQIKHKK